MGVNYDLCPFDGHKILRPSLKLIGGKTKLRGFLYAFFPKHSVYIEPFMGTGGVLIGKPRCEYEILGDLNWYAINYYRVLQRQPEAFWEHMNKAYAQFLEEPEYMFKLFKEYVVSDTTTITDSHRAVYFYLITKHCMNGIWRLNSGGYCNSSFGKETKGRGIFTREWFDAVRERINGVYFDNEDYRDTVSNALLFEGVPFIFLDPPYHDCKTTYNGIGWGDKDFQIFADYMEKWSEKAKWMLTINDDPFIRDLYKGYTIIDHEVFYSCSQTAAGRGRMKELIITNYDAKECFDEYARIAVDAKKETRTTRGT